jgi:hypothetical protein
MAKYIKPADPREAALYPRCDVYEVTGWPARLLDWLIDRLIALQK